MRLAVLDHGHPLRMKLVFALIRWRTRHPVPDVIKTLTYRLDYFGGRMSPLFHEIMRGPSTWSVGERELMAAYVSKVNSCEF